MAACSGGDQIRRGSGARRGGMRACRAANPKNDWRGVVRLTGSIVSAVRPGRGASMEAAMAGCDVVQLQHAEDAGWAGACAGQCPHWRCAAGCIFAIFAHGSVPIRSVSKQRTFAKMERAFFMPLEVRRGSRTHVAVVNRYKPKKPRRRIAADDEGAHGVSDLQHEGALPDSAHPP